MSKEMELAEQGVKIELRPCLIRGDEPRVSWHVNLVGADGRKLEGHVPKTFERAVERVRSIVEGESGG